LNIQVLVEQFVGKQVDELQVIALAGDASSRRYHRVILPGGNEPESLIVMELPEDALASDEITRGSRPEELPFLNVGRHMQERGLPVPKIYLDAVDSGALLLEDLGEVQFADKVQEATLETKRSWYGVAVDLMTKMHRSMWPAPKGCLAATRTFDYDLLRFELDHYREWGAEALLEKTLDSDTRQRLDNAFDVLAKEISTLPQGFVHRDYQSRNLMVLGDEPRQENLVIIDFQDAFGGPRIYDLVALLNDSYVDLEGDFKEEMVARYAEKMELDEGELLNEFRLITIQRKLKDGGRFVFIDRVKGNPKFLPFVDGSFARVRSGLARLEGHQDLKSILAEVDPGRFGFKPIR
jgi:N-acetylmuramate 1-kinase